MSIAFKVRRMQSRRRWAKYWTEVDNRQHVEFYRTMAAEWRESRRIVT